MEAGSLYRTFNPKVTLYRTDGKGRDNYIRINNGGLTISSAAQESDDRKPFLRTRNGYLPPAPRMQSPTLKYQSDGSGRDFYITYNSGGLQSPYTPGAHRDPFFASLRSDQRRTSLDPNDHLTRVNTRWCSPQSKAMIRKARLQVQSVTKRLFSPECKRTTQPNTKETSKKWADGNSNQNFARTSFN